MSRSVVHLLTLPDEILVIILKKLNNIDVLDLLLNLNNEHLTSLAKEQVFSNTLDLTTIDHQNKLDQFCIDILPIIHYNVQCFIIEATLMERILLAAEYPKLRQLKLLHFNEQILFKYLIDQSSLRYIFEDKFIDLILLYDHNKVNDIIRSSSLTKSNINIFEYISINFTNLKHLSILQSFNSLSLDHLPSTIFSSSLLTYLSLNIYTLDDCLHLLDGRLKQLTTLIVRIAYIDDFSSSSIIHNINDLPNLKCFSLKCNLLTDQYDMKILPLLHRMSYLQRLTLYLRLRNRNTFIDRTHLQNEILPSMQDLHSFTFYISTYDDSADLNRYARSDDAEQILTSINGHEHIANIINYTSSDSAVCHIFSLPFLFDRLEDIGDIFPNTGFNYVTYLLVQDIVPFNHQFFIRISRSFPLLHHLRIMNIERQSSRQMNLLSLNNNPSSSIAQYCHLIRLDVQFGNSDHVEEFLNETNAYVPCLTELSISYQYLRIVTNNFTREETRRNCASVKRLIMLTTIVHSKEFFLYFPLL